MPLKLVYKGLLKIKFVTETVAFPLASLQHRSGLTASLRGPEGVMD